MTQVKVVHVDEITFFNGKSEILGDVFYFYTLTIPTCETTIFVEERNLDELHVQINNVLKLFGVDNYQVISSPKEKLFSS